MSDTIIKLENISKQYRLGQVGTQTLRGDFQRWWHRLRGKEDPTLKIGQTNALHLKSKISNLESDYVWALRDINLEVKRGEVLGIIGKNGAGKSTLLKLLSRVTSPTTGQIKVKGRIASLLEVGTGFHPDLTGRENIFLNGAILGMTKSEIKGKFDEIVDFAGVAKYIDTPVKRYSSGMYVRLAFAVAAHLEPDILVVDEVLAVGDAEFQKKAIGKMQDISTGHGRTVLFVSHNMPSVKALCSKAVLMENGQIIEHGETDIIIRNYLVGGFDLKNFKKSEKTPIVKSNEIELYEIGVKAKNKAYDDIITLEDEIEFNAKYFQKIAEKEIYLVIVLKDELGNPIFSNGSWQDFNNKELGNFEVKTIFPNNFFNWGSIFLDLYFIENRKNSIIIEKDILSFTISNDKKEIGEWMGREPGPIHPKLTWIKEKYNNV
ncbi:MAG: ABC transporter ATP-binding protein [Bacteroidales bacterium]